jgi:osmoprotectant transport system permease protein
VTWLAGHLDDVLRAAWEHCVLVAVSISIAFAISLAVGVATSRRPRLYSVVMAVGAALYTVPSLALFALLIPLVGLGKTAAVVALVGYSLLILTRNIATGLREVPADVVESARGMGLGPWQILLRIELPLALPVIVAGVRIATVAVIGIATIAAYINAGGLGTLIFDGIQQSHPAKIVTGAVAASAMAIAVDLGLIALERRVAASRVA